MMRKENKPDPLVPVLARIHAINDLGSSQYFEVVYHDGESWGSFNGSKTFQDGEIVGRWKYIHNLWPEQLPDIGKTYASIQG